MKKLLLIIPFIFILNAPNFAQEEDLCDDHHEKTYKSKRSLGFKKGSNPFIKLNYGVNDYSHALAQEKFKRIGGIQVQLGYFNEKPHKEAFIINQSERFISFRLQSENLYEDNSTNKILMKSNLIGIGQNKNHGYKTKKMSFLLGTGKEFDWAVNKFDRTQIGVDTTVLDIYKDKIKFGESYNSNVSLRLFDFVSLDFSYNFGLIFPRHLFWKHAGSLLFEEVVNGMLRSFIDKVFSNRPIAGPLVNFALKSTLNYAFYELKKERMNWPLKTDSPLTYDFYSIGLKFTF